MAAFFGRAAAEEVHAGKVLLINLTLQRGEEGRGGRVDFYGTGNSVRSDSHRGSRAHSLTRDEREADLAGRGAGVRIKN